MTDSNALSEEQIIARSSGESYQQMLDKESNPVPDALRESTNTYLGSDNISVDRYLTREFHDLEVEKMWSRTWQAVCRESEIADVGNFFVYDIAKYSIVVTRNESSELKGYYNSCLHRGRQLRRDCGTAREFKCPFHGFRWSLDGDFLGAPCEWDFPHLDKENFTLPQVQVDTWGGWVFINMDLQAESLHSYLGILPEHFKRSQPENTYKVMHIEKVIECNWKLAWEAFIESYHAIATHPQLMPFQAIDNSQYDVWGDNVSRTITPYGVANPSHADQFSEQDSMDAIMRLSGNEDVPQVAEGQTARERLAEMTLPTVNEQVGQDLTGNTTMSELMDSTLYLMFPNLRLHR